MTLLEKLLTNKGTISNTLGKKLAKEILDGNIELLTETIPLVCYSIKNKKDKNVRAGAANIVEIVANEKPTIIVKYLEKLLPALEVEEPQTRWVILRTMGSCASLKPEIVKKAIPFAKKYIREKIDGQLCLVAAADMFLGDYGKISKETAKEVYPILLESTDNVIKNEHDWILEAFIKIAPNLSKKERDTMIEFADEQIDKPRKATSERIKKLKKLCSI